MEAAEVSSLHRNVAALSYNFTDFGGSSDPEEGSTLHERERPSSPPENKTLQTSPTEDAAMQCSASHPNPTVPTVRGEQHLEPLAAQLEKDEDGHHVTADSPTVGETLPGFRRSPRSGGTRAGTPSPRTTANRQPPAAPAAAQASRSTATSTRWKARTT